jgi:hypothetical protein
MGLDDFMGATSDGPSAAHAGIVLGKLGSRLVVVFGVTGCVLPVLAIMTALGGIESAATLGATLVVLAVATLGASLALTGLVAYALLRVTLASFDRLLRRMPENPRRRRYRPTPKAFSPKPRVRHSSPPVPRSGTVPTP